MLLLAALMCGSTSAQVVNKCIGKAGRLASTAGLAPPATSKRRRGTPSLIRSRHTSNCKRASTSASKQLPNLRIYHDEPARPEAVRLAIAFAWTERGMLPLAMPRRRLAKAP